MNEFKEACLDDLAVGQSCRTANLVREEDIIKYAEVSGDVNPLHMDENYARNSIFGTRIAHGMIAAGYISAIFGTKFPGPGCIFMSQSLKFKAPVRIGDEVETTVTIVALNEKRGRVTYDCICKVEEVVVLTGEAQLMIPHTKDT